MPPWTQALVTGTMARRRLLPNINVSAGDKITKGMVQFLNKFHTKRSDIANWQLAVSKTVTERTRKATEKGLVYTQQILFDKSKIILSFLERKSRI